MGATRELFSELFDLPEPLIVSNEHRNTQTISLMYRLPYAIVNLLFQLVDCILIPSWIIPLTRSFLSEHHIATLLGGILVTTASLFSWSQFIYYILKPTLKYTDLKSRLLGETAVGALISSLLRIQIHHYI